MGLLTLRALKLLERKLKQRRVSELRMKWRVGDFDASHVLSALRVADLQISKFVMREACGASLYTMSTDFHWTLRR